MKRNSKFLFLVVFLILGLLASCGNSNSTSKNEISATMLVNVDDEDASTDSNYFPYYSDKQQKYMPSPIAHFKINSKKEETIRVLVESRWGYDEKVREDFKIEKDYMKTVSPNEWYTIPIYTASNLYYWRITLYVGETEEILVTRTIHTPHHSSKSPEHEIENLNPPFYPYSHKIR